MSPSGNLFTELKRRKVFKVAVAYGVVAWLVIQVASTIAPQLNLPEWAPRFITLVVLLGFPIALVLSWMLDKTPEGLKIEPATVGNKRMLAIAAVLIALAVGWYWQGRPTSEHDDSSARSIAVLPFANMSGDPANEYFSDGISEEILNVLARAPELRVAARTSSFAYKGKTEDIPQIARELNVRMVLEGSVRKQGERVRITAQLIDAGTGFHAWSQTYDRDLQDIFAIQDEIAQAIASELKVRLAGNEDAGKNATGTTDLVAYDLYLRALALVPRRDPAEINQALELLEQAVKLDPQFARGWAMLAATYNMHGFYDPAADLAHSLDSSENAAERALALEPLSGEAYAVLGLSALMQHRYETGAALTIRATLLTPSSAQAYLWQATALRATGRLADAERANRRAVELDPNSFVALGNFAHQLAAEGRMDEAGVVLQRKLALDPDFATTHVELANLAMAAADHATAREHYLRVAQDAEARGLVEDAFAAIEEKDSSRELAIRVAEGLDSALVAAANPTRSNEATLLMLLALNESTVALDYLERVGLGNSAAARMRLAGFSLPTANVGQLRCEPRFQAVMAANGLVDGLAAKLCQ